MTKKVSMKQWLGLLVAVTFLANGLNMVTATRLYGAPKANVPAAAVSMVNINKAGAEELDTIRGIGPAMAQRIIEYREKNGPFKTVDDLVQVRGIGGAKLQKIKDQITV